MSLKISLYSPETFKTGDGVHIIFEVTNHFSHPVSVLKWYTPLEGLRSACLSVKAGRKEIRYDGIKVRRGNPAKENFLTLGPGESTSQKVNLEEVYALPQKGGVTVTFDSGKVIAADADAISKSTEFYHDAVKRRVKKIDSVGCTFRLQRSGKKIPTVGMQMRSTSKSSPGIKGTPKEPNMSGMSEAEKKKMKTAHINGHALAEGTLASMANDARYKKWFGAHTAARFAKVKNVFTKVKSGLESKQFTYVNNGPECEAGDIAYTYDGSDKIWLCQKFWPLPATGNNSHADTVVHEHSHASAFTEDHANGIDECIQLAKNKPDEAVNNGDSVAYYSQP